MIGKSSKRFCCEPMSLIENYDKAVNDNTQIWEIHHRFETDLNMSKTELIEKNLYFDRPASELILLTKSEHTTLHNLCYLWTQKSKEKLSNSLKGRSCWNKGKTGVYSKETLQKMSDAAKKRTLSEETRNKLRNAFKGKKHTEETKKKIAASHIGKTHSEETKRKIAEIHKGKHYINNGVVAKQVTDEEMPKYLAEGWERGNLCHRKK